MVGLGWSGGGGEDEAEGSCVGRVKKLCDRGKGGLFGGRGWGGKRIFWTPQKNGKKEKKRILGDISMPGPAECFFILFFYLIYFTNRYLA